MKYNIKINFWEKIISIDIIDFQILQTDGYLFNTNEQFLLDIFSINQIHC